MRSHWLARFFTVINLACGMAIVFCSSSAFGDNPCGAAGRTGCVGCQNPDGCQAIFDGTCQTFEVPINAPPGALVASVHYDIRVADFRSHILCGLLGQFMFCDDIQISIKNKLECNGTVKLWGDGGLKDCIAAGDDNNDNDAENDADIELHDSLLTQFDGCNATDTWQLVVCDKTPPNVFQSRLDKFEVSICYTFNCDDNNPCTIDSIANDGCQHPNAPADTACGDSNSSGCNAQDTCDGNGNCEDKLKSAGTGCRPATGPCDLPETCNGTSATCPTNMSALSGTNCGSSNSTECDAQDTCDGSGTCMPRFEVAGTDCRPATGPCDLPETCTGSSTTCPTDESALSGTNCGSSPSGVCDAQDTCDGSGACVDKFKLPAIVCRIASNECDLQETCTGSLATCPTDLKKMNGVACSDDGNACTKDECQGGLCGHPPISPCCTLDSQCGDTDPCTGDTCVANKCAHTNTCACQSDLECDDSNVCTKDSCVVNA